MYLRIVKLTRGDVDVEVRIDKEDCTNRIGIFFNNADDYIALTIKEAETLYEQLGFALQECDGKDKKE